jgi:methionyl aminopeptidase
MARPKKRGSRVTPRGTRPDTRAGRSSTPTRSGADAGTAPARDDELVGVGLRGSRGGGGIARHRGATGRGPGDRSAAVSNTAPVRPGVIGLPRTVPADIPRPPYAHTGTPPSSAQESDVRSPEVLERMRRAGAAAAEVLIEVGEAIAPGVTTDELDAIGHRAAIERGAYPSPLNYRGFRKSLCSSVNEVICHGIPDDRPLQDGDLCNIDITVYLDGVHGDTNCTFLVGDVDAESRRLVRETRTCLDRAIEAVRPGEPINVIGRAIEQHATAQGLGVVREFIGHGIGESFHTTLQIPHYYEPRATRVIEEGMTFTIEPMITLGDPSLYVWEDGWTAVTLDGSRSAQFEHTMVVRADGAEILTRTADGRCAHDTGGAPPPPPPPRPPAPPPPPAPPRPPAPPPSHSLNYRTDLHK